MKWVIGIVIVGALAYYIYVSTMPAPSGNVIAPNPTEGDGSPPNYVPAPWHQPEHVQPPPSYNGPSATDSSGTPVIPSIGLLPSVLVGPRALSIPSSQIFKPPAPPRAGSVYAAAQLGPQPQKA